MLQVMMNGKEWKCLLGIYFKLLTESIFGFGYKLQTDTNRYIVPTKLYWY